MDNNIVDKKQKYIELADFKELANNYYRELTKLSPIKGIGSHEHIYFTYGIEWAFNHLPQSVNENEKLKRLLEDLTPGGSEFVNDPQYCFDFVKKELRSIPSQVLPFKQRSDKLKVVNDSLLEALKGFVDYLDSDLSEAEIILLAKAKAAIQKAEE